MKVCPKCRNQYTDVSLRYCLQDGTELVTPSAEKTEQFSADEFSAADTVAVNAKPTTPEAGGDDQRNESEEAVTVVARRDQTAEERTKRRPKGKGVSGFVAGLLVGLMILGLVIFVGAAIWFLPSYFDNDPEEEFVEKPGILTREAISRISASSVRKRDGMITYSPENAIDRDDATAWCEGGRRSRQNRMDQVRVQEASKVSRVTYQARVLQE